MLKIRLQRIGRKNDPSFRVVLTDSKNSTKSGKFLHLPIGQDHFNAKYPGKTRRHKRKYKALSQSDVRVLKKALKF